LSTAARVAGSTSANFRPSSAFSASAPDGYLETLFDLIDLLDVFATMAILAGKAKQEAQGIVCLNNLKELCLAWTLLAGNLQHPMGFLAPVVRLRFVPEFRGVPDPELLWEAASQGMTRHDSIRLPPRDRSAARPDR
jgi:hypothetical protein